jgi:hypothetical protein
MRDTIENIIAESFKFPSHMRKIMKLDQYKKELEDFHSEIFTQFPEIHALKNVKPTYSADEIGGVSLSKQELQVYPKHYCINDIIEANISNDNLTKFACSLLIRDLFRDAALPKLVQDFWDHALYILELIINCNPALTYYIFKDFPEDRPKHLVDTYNEIRESDFMTKMRNKYMENGELKQ